MVYLWAIVVSAGVIGCLAIVLSLAERLLVQRKNCRVTISEETQVRELEVASGQTLLSVLQDAGMQIPASCGGKGSCGYCKVRISSGGGPVLPTELPFLSRRELTDGLRLACQVKVKMDLALKVPDLLEVVEEMVRNRTIDTTKRWRFQIKGDDGSC